MMETIYFILFSLFGFAILLVIAFGIFLLVDLKQELKKEKQREENRRWLQYNINRFD